MSKKKNILFLLLALPDLKENSNIYSDLVEEFARNGENIFVVAPSINNAETCISNEKGVEILRVKTLPLFGVGAIKKGIANILLPYQFYKAIERYYNHIHFDTIIIPTPPITLESLVSKLKNKHKASVYLILRDIFPQNAVDLGMMKKGSLVYKYFRKQERRLYNISDHIGCMSQGNVDYIINHNIGIDPKKLHVLMNFQKVLPRDRTLKSDLKNKYGLDGKFVVVFGGNLGVPQKIQNVISFAQVIEKRYTDVVILLIGSGTQMEIIRSIIFRNGIQNIAIKDKIPRHDYQQLVCACDVGLISLNERFTIPNIPSKTMAYHEAAIPVLASIDSATDFGQILEQYHLGLWNFAGDIKTMVENFDRLYNDLNLRNEMGLNGRSFLENNMRIEVAYNTISSKINK